MLLQNHFSIIAYDFLQGNKRENFQVLRIIITQCHVLHVTLQVQLGMTVQNRATALQSEEASSCSAPQKSYYGQFHKPYCQLSYVALNHCLIDEEAELIIRFC